MPGCSRYFTTACLVALGCGPALPGDRQNSEEYTIKAKSDLVVLDVGVTGGQGRYIAGLTSSNFEVLDNGHPRKISYFSSADSPVTVGLVLDNSGSMASKRREVILAGLGFASTSNPKDEYFVVNFNDHLEYGLPRNVPFTDQIEPLRRALNWGRPLGETKLYDAVASALNHVSQSSLPYHVLIVVSDGGDNASTATLAELQRLVEESRVTIYTVGLVDPENHDLNPSVLKKLAKLSGGEYFQPDELDDVVPVFKHISSEIRHRYVLGFVPDETSDASNVRTVKVRATEDGRKLSVRTRSCYILDDPKQAVSSETSKNVL